ncbi:MAG: hypothetical protein KIT73_10160, partial [Burkholderiales bacterium]|nr:hypothetical protein [Burkholderiales bacterium]
SAIVAQATQSLQIDGGKVRPPSTRDLALVELYGRVQILQALVAVRPEVLAFALLMEERLREKDAERAGNSWQRRGNLRQIGIALLSKAMAVDAAIIAGGHGLNHAVDAANYAMMVADLSGALHDGLGLSPRLRATLDSLGEEVR